MTDGTPTTEEVDHLFARLAGGDRSVITRAFQVIHPMVRRFCERMLGNAADGDDATQQALERVFERVTCYDPERHALPWILGIAAWEVRTIRRRQWRSRVRGTDVDDTGLAGGSPDPEAMAISRQELAAIEDLVEQLSPTDRGTLRQVIEQEVAAGLDIATDPRFRKRKERALHRLRSVLRNLGHVQ